MVGMLEMMILNHMEDLVMKGEIEEEAGIDTGKVDMIEMMLVANHEIGMMMVDMAEMECMIKEIDADNVKNYS
jgi:hypothetical protein